MARTASTSTAVAPAVMSHERLMELLTGEGAIAHQQQQFHRMSLISGSLVTDPGTPNEETWPPGRKGAPTMTVQIVKPPVYYSAFFLDASERNGAISPLSIGRPDLDKKFVKKYDDPSEQAADPYSNVEVYDDIVRIAGKNGQFKADIQLRIVLESGQLTGDEPVYTLSLSTTSALDWRGTSNDPAAGVAQEYNFMWQLGVLASQQAAERGEDEAGQTRAVVNALGALRLGGVIADVYLHRQTSKTDPNISWTVVSFVPVHIQMPDEQPALPTGETVVPEEAGDIPF